MVKTNIPPVEIYEKREQFGINNSISMLTEIIDTYKEDKIRSEAIIYLGKLSNDSEVLKEQCFEILGKNVIPDLILLDILMPKMDGWDVYKKIKENPEWENIPIVFLTATDAEISKARGDSIAEDFIEKPFDVKDLKQRIDIILRKI